MTGERPSFADEMETGPLPTVQRVQVDSVVVVGDSITAGSEPQLRAALAAAGVDGVVIDAQPGRRIEVGNGLDEPLAGVRVVRDRLAAGADPDVWVIALGTNDVGAYPDAAAYAGLVDQVLTQLPADARVVWVDVHLPRRAQAAAEFDAAVRDRVLTRPGGYVASWFDVASAPGAELLTADGVHPNAAGREAFAALVVQALQRL